MINGHDAKHLEIVRAAIAPAKELLATNPLVDTFADRKTYDPFPNEDGEQDGNGYSPIA